MTRRRLPPMDANVCLLLCKRRDGSWGTAELRMMTWLSFYSDPTKSESRLGCNFANYEAELRAREAVNTLARDGDGTG